MIFREVERFAADAGNRSSVPRIRAINMRLSHQDNICSAASLIDTNNRLLGPINEFPKLCLAISSHEHLVNF